MLEENELMLAACEAFIRRSAQVDAPFMLKGSLITRQYMAQPSQRFSEDLDFVCLEHMPDPEQAENLLSQWATAVTDAYENDGVRFQSFSENRFWRSIDYAMADDFPTVNTDLRCWVNGQELPQLDLDVSFNLEIKPPPVPLHYRATFGSDFELALTCPLALQISWKLHQTITSGRFKDLWDLVQLLESNPVSETLLQQIERALVEECRRDSVDIARLRWFATREALDSYWLAKSEAEKHGWRYMPKTPLEKNMHIMSSSGYAYARSIPALEHASFDELLQQFMHALHKAGFTLDRIASLPNTLR